MKIFISHIHEDKDLAIKFKNWIEESFLGQVEVFASSYPNDIKLGNKWLEEIEKNIFDSNILLVLANEISLTRLWIYFEAGAGWGQKIPIISICFGEINTNNIPSPLSFFQSSDLKEENFSKNLFKAITLHCNFKSQPNIDYKKMDEELLELISAKDLSELGYVDHIIDMTENYNKMNEIFIWFTEEMEKIQLETELLTSEINQVNLNPNAFDAKRIQTISRKYSKVIKNFTIGLSNSNNEYSLLIERTNENINFILSFDRLGTNEEKEELEKIKPIFELVINQAIETKSSVDELSKIMASLPKFERHLKKEISYCVQELDKFSDNIKQNILSFRTSQHKVENILKEYE